MAADEAYYWVWSHHLQWSYFDHPPMVAFLLWLGHPFENWGSMVRWPALFLGQTTLLVWWALLKGRLSEFALKLWMALALLTPLLGFGSLLVTPDLPVLFFWALSLFFFERALETRRPVFYTALGFSLGLGFCSKYQIVLLVPVLLIYLSTEKKWRKMNPSLVVFTIVAGLVACFPVLYWNWLNDWKSFRFQLEHGLGRTSWNWQWTLTYVLGQILLFSPFLFFAFIRSLRRPHLRLFSWNALFVWIFFLYSSFKSVVEANWSVIGFAPAYAVAVDGVKTKKGVFITCGFWVVVCLIATSQWIRPWLPSLPENLIETEEYRRLSPYVEKYSPLFANTYQMAAILSFETKKEVLKLNDMSRYDFYDELPESKPAHGPLYLIKREGQNLPKWVQQGQTRIEPVEKVGPNFEILRVIY